MNTTRRFLFWIFQIKVVKIFIKIWWKHAFWLRLQKYHINVISLRHTWYHCWCCYKFHQWKRIILLVHLICSLLYIIVLTISRLLQKMWRNYILYVLLIHLQSNDETYSNRIVRVSIKITWWWYIPKIKFNGVVVKLHRWINTYWKE